MTHIRLSPSKLGDYNRCTRCFHDAYSETKVPKPRGIFPSLPGGMDLVMKNYADRYRGKLPPFLKGKVPGVLMPDLILMNKWRNWRTGPTFVDEKHEVSMIGALDDCLVVGGVYIPLDWKTKGSIPKDSGAQYYQTQMDCYNLMLNFNGFPVRNEAHLIYISPKESFEISGSFALNFEFNVTVYELECNKERAHELLIKAVECLRGPRPKVTGRCEHCLYLEEIKCVPEAKNNETV